MSPAYFFHKQPPPEDGRPLQNATRYLCAGAYLDQSMSRQLIKEFIDEEHRAVVPSRGFDLRPVLAHCLRARRLRILRDLALTALMVFFLLINALGAVIATVSLAGIAIVLMMFAGGWRGPKRITIVLVFWLFGGPVILFAPLLLLLLFALGQVGPQDYDAQPYIIGDGTTMLVAVLVYLTVPTVPVIHRIVMLHTLRGLEPGSSTQAPTALSPKAQRRLARVAAAQRGNVTLYSRENPFIGSGDVESTRSRAWSIVLELDKPATGHQTPAPVDPVALHRHVRTRIEAMRGDPPPRSASPDPHADDQATLPANERVPGLVASYHVVASGECTQGPRPLEPNGPDYTGHPLIDPREEQPFAFASDEAIDALIRHPQAAIRCYQRITVATPGQAVRDGHQRAFVPAEDQDLLLSAFLYLAVEGNMLYGQFLLNALPPIRRDFRVVDELPSFSPGMIVARAIRDGGMSAVGEGLLAPLHLAEEAARGLRSQFGDGGPSPALLQVFDYGARISVRELAAEPRFHTFMQRLDIDKYTRMIERRITEAVLEYLHNTCHIDVSAYKAQAGAILNNPFIMTGGLIKGQVAMSHGTIVQQQTTTEG